MSALTKIEPMNLPSNGGFDEKQIQLLKNTICKGSTDDELKFFIYTCQKTGLDPFSKQIYSVPRGGQRVIQTSVDGYRLIAERTGRYTPGREPTYSYKKDGSVNSATSYVMKQTKDGSWHEVAASAFFDEYDGKNNFWKKMPHLMLAKCAECLALRKAFPAEMSGLYSEEEMQQSDVEIKASNVKPLYMNAEIPKISTSQAIELAKIMSRCSKNSQENFINFLNMKYKINIIDELPENEYEFIKKRLILSAEDYEKAQAEEQNIVVDV